MDYRQNGDQDLAQVARNTQTTDGAESGNLQYAIMAGMDTTRYLEQESVG